MKRIRRPERNHRRRALRCCEMHCETNGDYDLIHKSNFLNPAVRIPLIVKTPEMKTSSLAGKIIDTPVELFDAGPTLSDFAEAKITHAQFAKSLLRVLQDSSHDHRTFAVSEFVHETMYLDRDWKLMLNRDDAAYRLFDLKNDPAEQNDLVGQKKHESLLAELKEKLLDYRKRTQK